MYTLSQNDIDEVGYYHRTGRNLPDVKDIPDQFWKGNIYTKIIEAWYVGDKTPPAVISFNVGFNQDAKKVKLFLMSHLSDWETNYEHRIAGVAYMMSKIFTITEN